VAFCLSWSMYGITQDDSIVRAEIDELYVEALGKSNQGEDRASIVLIEKAISRYESIGAWTRMVESIQLAAKNYVKLNNFIIVDSLLEVCNDLIDTHEIDNVDVAVQSYFLLGAAYHEKGLYQKSLNSFNFAIRDFLGEGRESYLDSLSAASPNFTMNINMILGHLYNYAAFPLIALGRYDEGLDYFRAANFFYEKTHFPPQIFGSYINLGMAYSAIGQYQEAKSWLQKVLDQFEGNDDGVLYLASAYNHLVNIANRQKNYALESEILSKLDELLIHPNMKHLESATGTSLDAAYCGHLAKKCLNAANLSQCNNSFELAQICKDTLLRIDKDLEFVVKTLHDLGASSLVCQKPNEAISIINTGIKIIEKNALAFDDIDKDKFLSVERIELLYLMGSAYAQLGSQEGKDVKENYEKGLKFVSQSIDLLEGLRIGLVQSSIDNLSREKSLLDLDNKYKGNFALAIEINYQLFKITGNPIYAEVAFEYSERGKAFALRQGMNRVVKIQGLDVDSRVKLQELESKLFFFEKKIGLARGFESDKKRQNLYSDYILLKEEYKSTLAKIKKTPTSQRIFNEIYQDEVSGVAELQSYLQDKEMTFLICFSHENAMYLFKCTSDTLLFEKVELGKKWEADLKFVKEAILDLDLTTNVEAANRFVSLHEDWYQLFFANYINFEKRICIVPDQAIFGINFNLLIDEQTPLNLVELPATSYKIVDFSTPSYLLKNRSTFEAHSVSIFLNEIDLKREKSKPLDLISFSPSYQKRNAKYRSDVSYIPLAELSDDLNGVMPLFDPSKVERYVDHDATVDKFRKKAQARARILHLSAHGIINEFSPYLSYLAMAYKGEESNKADVDLLLGEVFNLNIDSEMAIISACQSGTTELRRGDAKINFARAFRYANCPGIIMGLWAIDDQSTANIFPNFYRELKNGNTGDQSLALSQKEYLSDKKNLIEQSAGSISEKESLLIQLHPYYWAGLAALGRFEKITF